MHARHTLQTGQMAIKVSSSVWKARWDIIEDGRAWSRESIWVEDGTEDTITETIAQPIILCPTRIRSMTATIPGTFGYREMKDGTTTLLPLQCSCEPTILGCLVLNK